jgi:hypothetical protein
MKHIGLHTNCLRVEDVIVKARYQSSCYISERDSLPYFRFSKFITLSVHLRLFFINKLF